MDIATELESYLEVLEGVQFSFADGQAMNFAEGAQPGALERALIESALQLLAVLQVE